MEVDIYRKACKLQTEMNNLRTKLEQLGKLLAKEGGVHKIEYSGAMDKYDGFYLLDEEMNKEIGLFTRQLLEDKLDSLEDQFRAL